MLSKFTNSYRAGSRPNMVAAPTNILNLAVWYDSSISNTTNFQTAPANGAAVTAWKDKSGLGRDANQSGPSSAKPKWYSSLYNGGAYGGLRFNGSSESLNINPVAYLQSLTGYTMYVVAKPLSLASAQVLTSTDTDGFKFYFDGTYWGVKTGGGAGLSSVTGNTNRLHLFTMVYDGNQTGNAARLRFRYDSSEQNLSFTGTVAATTNAAASKLFIAVDSTGSAQYFNCEIASILTWTRPLVPSELLSVDNFLKSYYGI